MPSQQRIRDLAEDLRPEPTNSKDSQTVASSSATAAKVRRNGRHSGHKDAVASPLDVETPHQALDGQTGVIICVLPFGCILSLTQSGQTHTD